MVKAWKAEPRNGEPLLRFHQSCVLDTSLWPEQNGYEKGAGRAYTLQMGCAASAGNRGGAVRCGQERMRLALAADGWEVAKARGRDLHAAFRSGGQGDRRND